MSRKDSFTVVLERQPDGGFTVTVPALPEVVTEGDTEDQALRMAEDAIVLALGHRRESGLPIPKDLPPTLRRVIVETAA